MFQRFADNWFVSWILVPLGMILFLHFVVFSAYNVLGNSMVPTLQNKDYLIISKVARSAAIVQGKPYIPQRNQVIVFHYPKQPTLDYVKRTVGLPGDRVVVRDCLVTIYNAQNPQGFNPDTKGGYATAGDCTAMDTDVTVPAGSVFVLGDNRLPGGSSDSREWGLLPSDDIVGNVVLRLYPFSDIRAF